MLTKRCVRLLFISGPHVNEQQVFLLYTNLQSAYTEHRGLGYVDSRKDTLSVYFELKPPILQSDSFSKRGKTRKNVIAEKVLEVELAQDKTALRSRKGDTGSVLWRAR
jgi:protein N-lysine methyltransferase METTL21D